MAAGASDEPADALGAVAFVRDMLLRAGVGARYLESSLIDYQPRNFGQQAALEECDRYVSTDAWRQGHGLLLLGPPETGKTHLLVGILRGLLERSQAMAETTDLPAVRYCTAEDFFVGLRGAIQAGREEAYLHEQARPVVLVLDDLTVVTGDESYQYRMLWHLLDIRYRNKRATLCASNRDAVGFRSMVDERTRRRIDGQIITIASGASK